MFDFDVRDRPFREDMAKLKREKKKEAIEIENEEPPAWLEITRRIQRAAERF